MITRFGVGARMSLATEYDGTGYFAVTPQWPYDATLSTAEQTRQLLAKADARLAEIGSDKSRLLFVAIVLRDLADLAAFNETWDHWIEDVAPPARACFEAKLAHPDLKVEMIMVSATDAPDAQ